MKVANRVKVDRFEDHIVLRFGLSADTDPAKREELGELVEELIVPITTTANLAQKLFEAVVRSTLELTLFFTNLQQSFNSLNVLSAEVEKEKTDIASAATTAATKAAGKVAAKTGKS